MLKTFVIYYIMRQNIRSNKMVKKMKIKLKECVEKKDISLRQCARKMGIKYQALWRIYQGIGKPTLIQAAKIVEWSEGELDFWDLLDDDELNTVYPGRKIG